MIYGQFGAAGRAIASRPEVSGLQEPFRTTPRPQDPRPQALDGVLVVDKTEGPTSHDVVKLARRALGVSRIGHTGTLDPMATGVLPLVIGRATRLAQFLTASDKTYEATVAFGRTTNTSTRPATVIATSDRAADARRSSQPRSRNFAARSSRRRRRISAKNIDGERSYDLARKAGTAVGAAAQSRVTVT